MSFTRSMYDVNNYSRDLQSTIGQGNYTLNNSNENCDDKSIACFMGELLSSDTLFLMNKIEFVFLAPKIPTTFL